MSSYDKIPFMTDSARSDLEWIDIIQNLRNIRFTYQILYSSAEGAVEIETFQNPVKAFDFYVSLSVEQVPELKCLITGSLGNFFYSSLARLKLTSLAEIIDQKDEIPFHIRKTAVKVLATRIRNDLPFNSDAHGLIL